ncbi:MAG: MOSC domain-containing protein [Saprospiraceae bacterium]|nr:MOSC domain-containing protein [Bacteroidia bacterium]NNE13552.1 MOSC domain-containing protein [Saprospiraceae bacterium]NNL93072.1 MOSC domain-containing protein [Saprospiraceae bacterium]
MKNGRVIAVHKCPHHQLSKISQPFINIIEGQGIEGDAHKGMTVKHRSRVRKDPTQPNLRQVHLMHSELFDELSAEGFDIEPGMMGENITTQNIDLLNLPKDTILNIGDACVIQITGLRNPCNQLNGIQEGLMENLVYKNKKGELIRKAGIMAIVLKGGIVKKGDAILVNLPSKPLIKLDRV